MSVNGERVVSCLTLAASIDGSDVLTIEGISEGGALNPLQQAFVDCDGFQCGYCTPGMILMSKKLLDENPEPTDDDVRHYLSGNLCRCAAYPEIIDAVKRAGELRKSD